MFAAESIADLLTAGAGLVAAVAVLWLVIKVSGKLSHIVAEFRGLKFSMDTDIRPAIEQINNAVNHVGPGTPPMVQRLRTVEMRLDHLAEKVGTIDSKLDVLVHQVGVEVRAANEEQTIAVSARRRATDKDKK